MIQRTDALIVGGGHNGLVAAVLLAKAGLSVRVVEERPVLGGATRTEQPFANAPGVRQSTGAYLLGLMPPELISELGVDIPTMRRDPHYFLPTTEGRYLLFGSDLAQTEAQFREFFSEADWRADRALAAELGALREDVGPTWLMEPLSIEETAERFVRPALRSAFVGLCRGSVGEYLERFGFESDLVKAMYAVTDGFTGLYGGWDTPGSGMNFLIHNMCRLPDADGTWMVVRGGMGTVSRVLAEAAAHVGTVFETGKGVTEILVEAGTAKGVRLADGTERQASVVVVGADPFRMLAMVPEGTFPVAFTDRIRAMRRDGTTMKVNMALSDLPRFTCLPEPVGQHRGTIHILPDEKDVMEAIQRAWSDVKAGKLPEQPTIEWYVQSTVDPTMADEQGRHSSALFVQWVPYALEGTSWEVEEERYTQHLLSLCDRLAPGTSDRVVDTFTLTPPKVEIYFGITRGHIHHVDNTFGFDDRVPYVTPIDGLYMCSAGCHPGGSVIGASGHNAAKRILADLDRGERSR